MNECRKGNESLVLDYIFRKITFESFYIKKILFLKQKKLKIKFHSYNS
jgi:hypothetical protein